MGKGKISVMAIQNGRSKMCFYRFSMGDRELAIQTSSKVQNMWIIPELAFKLNFLAAPGKSHADYGYAELLTGLVLIEVKII